jgi:ABC-type nitrate/sulfonate/bicarbonate transport system permease component
VEQRHVARTKPSLLEDPLSPMQDQGGSRRGLRRVAFTLKTYGPAVVLFVLFIAVWQGVVVGLNIKPYLVPRPTDIARSLWDLRAALFSNGIDTLKEVLIGFTLAFGFGTIFAALIAESDLLRRAFYPLIVGSQTIPVVAIAPLILIWFGFGILSKIVVAAFISFFPIVVNTATGLTSLESELVRLMRSFPASRWKVFWKARVPAALPYLFAGMKISIVLSVIGAVVGEYVGSSTGLGHYIVQQNALLQTTVVFAAIVALSILGVMLFLLVSLLERVSIPWYYAAKGQEGR